MTDRCSSCSQPIPDLALCASCGHGWSEHRIDLKRRSCSRWEGKECPCRNYEPKGKP